MLMTNDNEQHLLSTTEFSELLCIRCQVGQEFDTHYIFLKTFLFFYPLFTMTSNLQVRNWSNTKNDW